MTTTESEPTVATALKPEVVGDLPADTDTPGAPLPAVPEHAAANAFIEKAAEQALMPGVPGRDEFITLAMTARMLCMSGAAPKEVQNNPYLAFHMAMVGRDLGISPSASLELIDVIPGGNNRPPRLSLSPQLLNGQVERLGLGHIVKAASTIEGCWAIAVAPGGEVDYRCRRSWPDHVDDCGCHGVIGESEFTWDDARMAGLVGPKCNPGQHDQACLAYGGNGPKCNQGYKTYPKRMMWWRAAGFCADDWFPTASMGLYSPEALGAVVDEEGRPIDPSTVKLPDGYEPEPPKAPEAPALADTKVTTDLSRRIYALPADARDLLAAKWTEKDSNDHPYLQPLQRLPERQLKRATALVVHYEERAAKGEWGDWTPPPAPPETDPPNGGSDGDAAKTDEDPAAPVTPADPPAGDGAGDPPPPPVTEHLPGTPEEPTARVGVPQAPDATASESAPNPGNPADCPVCAGTGLLEGETCWGCEGGLSLPPCNFCGSTTHFRHDLGGDVLRCIDQDACWEREQSVEKGEKLGEPPVDVASTDVTQPPADAPVGEGDPDVEPLDCPLCHSSKSKLVFVPNGHGQEGGIWRCQNASACRERVKGKSGVDIARAALGEQAPPSAQ